MIEEFIKSKGYDFKPEYLDGKFHELKTSRGKVWYKGKIIQTSTGKQYTRFIFGNYKEASRYELPFNSSGYSTKEKKEIEEIIQKEKIREEKARSDLQEEIAERSQKAIGEMRADDGSTDYSKRKQIGPVPGAYIRTNPIGQEALIIPMKDYLGKVWGYQSITENDKTFVDGQRMQGLFFQLGQLHGRGIFYLCEGIATAMSLFLAKNSQKPEKNLKKTKKTSENDKFCIVSCLNGGNLRSVAQVLRQNYPDSRIVICSDNDIDNGSHLEHNPGLRYAYRAAHAARASVLIAPTVGDETDFNDIHVNRGLDRVADALESHKALGPEQIIPTEYNGFHEPVIMANGHSKLEPKHLDMVAWFDREHPFKIQSESEQIYVWDSKKYVDTPKSELRAIANQKFWIDWEPNCNNHLAREFLGAVQRTNTTALSWFHRTTEGLLNFENGVLDTRTGKLSSHSAVRGFRAVLNYPYMSEALCPAFDEMLNNISQGDKALETLLLEYMGYCISGERPWLQKALVCVGEGANGKSTFFKILKAMVGPENVSSVNAASFDNDQRMYLLDGKLLNISEETGDKALFKTSEEFKNLVTGGDIVAKKLYAQPYEFENRAKLILSYNTFPRASDTSHGLIRRLLFANFNAVFDQERGNLDLGIEKRALEELSGIFNKAWAAYLAVKERGEFTKSQQSIETLKQFQYESDNVLQFWEERCGIADKNWQKNGQDLPKWCRVDGESGKPFAIVDELYAEYHDWCKTRGMMPLNHVHFSRRVVRVCCASKIDGAPRCTKRVRIDGVQHRILEGVVRCV